ncbi:MAG TPA: hypothetical protein VNA68_00600 [Candidatus Dormibacteraeota bacterium]|nr:hypothetical protein [Candidatus Dormibacteraeota bacterium]
MLWERQDKRIGDDSISILWLDRGMKPVKQELDSIYFLKILLYFIIGSVWFAFNEARLLPFGLILGLLAVRHEKLQIDRKIEYAILVIASLLGLFGIGITVTWRF